MLMSKIIYEYERLKKHDSSKHYLFKLGKFYCFIGDDANYINEYMVLKKTKFSQTYEKCGFPVERLNNYLKVFKNLNINVEIIETVNGIPWYEEIKDKNIKKLTKKEAIYYLEEAITYMDIQGKISKLSL